MLHCSQCLFSIDLYSLLSSAVYFCLDGYTCGNVRKPATLCVCILHSDDQILTVNSLSRPNISTGKIKCFYGYII